MRSMMRIISLMLVCSTIAWAQSDRGSITGTVTDSTGGIVPDAAVTATNTATNVVSRTATNDTGVYAIPALVPGVYKVRVEKNGFKAAEQVQVVLAASSTVRVDVGLQVGEVSESVEVSSSLGATADRLRQDQYVCLQQDGGRASARGGRRDAKSVRLGLGFAGRQAGGRDRRTGTDEAFALGGGQVAAWGVTLDGVSAGTGRFASVQWASVNTPSLDAITEFTVDTNGYKAEYGRASGGIMSFTSKSGTNELHGTVYEFVRNNAFDARRFFEAQKAVYKQHDFGWSVGGPVWLPKLYNGKNKTFFFSSMEWFRNRVGATSTTDSLPTPEMYRGDFSNWVDANGNKLTIYDPRTTRPNPNGTGFIRDPFPGNIIPQDRFSTFAKAVLSAANNVGVPNNGAAPGSSAYVRNNFINNQGTVIDPWTKFSVKIDHAFTDNSKVNFLYNYGKHDGPQAGAGGFPGLPGILNSTRTGRQKSDVYRGAYTWVIKPTVVNNAFGGINFWKEKNASPNATGGWKSKGVCLINAFDCDATFVQVEFSDYGTWGGSAGDGSENFVFSFGDDLTIIKGKHNFKMGYLYERVHYNGFGRQTLSGLVRGDRRSRRASPGTTT